jgi:ABC-type bacteriocin/lantibiotic exporter with double-glycine peptidase domain
MSPRLVAPSQARILRREEPLTIEFKHVWFRYAADAPNVLQDISVTLRQASR